MEHITTVEEFKKIINENDKVIIDFYAEWCGPCKMLSPIMEEVSGEHQEIKFVKVDVDQSQELSEMFGIQSIPLVAYITNKKLVLRELGFKPKQRILDNIKELFK